MKPTHPEASHRRCCANGPSLARTLASATASALLAATSTTAWSHPGHVDSFGLGAGFLHPLLGIDHLLAMLAVGLWAAQLGGRALWGVPLAFVAAMLAGAALDMMGLAIPAAEPMIAASVLALGLLLCLRVRVSPAVAAVPIVAFALVHGAAHASQMPDAVDVSGYVLGFVLATAVLHAAGLLAGLSLKARASFLRATGVPIAATGLALVGMTLLRAA